MNYGENLYVSVIIYRYLSVSVQMEVVHLVYVLKVGGCRLIRDVYRVIERQIPYREGLELSVTRLHPAFIFVIQL